MLSTRLFFLMLNIGIFLKFWKSLSLKALPPEILPFPRSEWLYSHIVLNISIFPTDSDDWLERAAVDVWMEWLLNKDGALFMIFTFSYTNNQSPLFVTLRPTLV